MCKKFGGRELCGIDSVKQVSNLIDQIHKRVLIIRGIAIALPHNDASLDHGWARMSMDFWQNGNGGNEPASR